MGKAIGYELRDGGFYWTGESDLTAARILAVEDTGDGKSARDEAADFLRDELADGPVEWQQIERDRKAAGISEITLRRARESLGVKIRREGEPGRKGGGRSVWELPEVLSAQKDLLVQDVHIEKKEQVNQTSFKNDPSPKTSEQVNTPEAVLGMPVNEALELWRSQGAPMIHLGPGGNCEKLDLLLSNPNVKPEHLLAVKAWLEKLKQGSDR
jgi:hypothetical protein